MRRLILKRAGWFCLLALLSSMTFILAQDTEPLTVLGSGIVNSVVESLAEAHETPAIRIATIGTSAGFDQFCRGDADIATASRAITADEDAACIANEIAYSEFILAHSILAFVSHPEAPLQCLTESEMDDLFKPSAANQLRNWSSYDESLAELPITFILPQDNRVEYVILDSLTVGDGLRRDAETYENSENAIARISETAGAIAALPFSSDLADRESLTVLELDSGGASGCVSPSAESVENRQYPAARSLFLYVNRARLEQNQALASLTDLITSEAAAEVIAEVGFVPPTADIYALNADILLNAEAGRLFSRDESAFEMPAVLNGQIDISGSANAYQLLNSIATQLTSGNQQLTINLDASGQSDGIRRLCNGETDIAVLAAELEANALNPCEASDIKAVSVSIGKQATVLLGNAADEHASCLTSAQIRTIWHAKSADSINRWSNLDEAFPEQDMTLFGLATVDRYTDILMTTPGQATPPIRRDTEIDYNPLYRAAAVGNVPGALTYMSWEDYQRVLDNEQANIQVVSVDNGIGCIRPSEDSISNGTYSLARPAGLLVSELSLADMNVQAFLWQLFSEQGWSVIENEGFIGLSFVDLAAVRSHLETQFSLAEAAAAAQAAVETSENETEPDSSD